MFTFVFSGKPVKAVHPVHPSPALCKFTTGDGTGGTEKKIGGQTGNACIKACLAYKKKNKKVNGVTVFRNNKPGCWCEIGMKTKNKNKKYKTCFLPVGK